MAYSNFNNFQQLQKDFGLKMRVSSFWADAQNTLLAPSERLLNQLKMAEKLPVYLSEKARSELIISPVLLEIWARKADFLMLFSGVSLDVDAARGLNGICDFLIAKTQNQYVIETPILCLIEAKNRELSEGFAQCVAEMYASQILNRQSDNPKTQSAIFGCITNGREWQFLKLEEDCVFIDLQRYFLNELDKILGILDWITAA